MVVFDAFSSYVREGIFYKSGCVENAQDRIYRSRDGGHCLSRETKQ